VWINSRAWCRKPLLIMAAAASYPRQFHLVSGLLQNADGAGRSGLIECREAVVQQQHASQMACGRCSLVARKPAAKMVVMQAGKLRRRSTPATFSISQRNTGALEAS